MLERDFFLSHTALSLSCHHAERAGPQSVLCVWDASQEGITAVPCDLGIGIFAHCPPSPPTVIFPIVVIVITPVLVHPTADSHAHDAPPAQHHAYAGPSTRVRVPASPVLPRNILTPTTTTATTAVNPRPRSTWHGTRTNGTCTYTRRASPLIQTTTAPNPNQPSTTPEHDEYSRGYTLAPVDEDGSSHASARASADCPAESDGCCRR